MKSIEKEDGSFSGGRGLVYRLLVIKNQLI
jgi:hypothetical protein